MQTPTEKSYQSNYITVVWIIANYMQSLKPNKWKC